MERKSSSLQEKQLELIAEFRKTCSHKCTKWPIAPSGKTKLELKKAQYTVATNMKNT